MNNLLNETFGIDEPLQDLQIDLYEELRKKWQGEIQGYGKVYRNPLNTGRKTAEAYATSRVAIPEWYNSLTKDYEGIYYNDNYSCVFCFLPSEESKTEDEFTFTNNVKIIFSSDLDRIYPNKNQRLDSKQVEEAVKIIRSLSYGRFKVKGIETRIENIFREFSTAKIKFNNMNKRHVFAVEIELSYTINEKCD